MSGSRDITYQVEKKILENIAQGDEKPLGELYDTYKGLVYSIAIRILEDKTKAEEITQEVFIQVWRKAATYNAQKGKVSSWLSRIARNKAIDFLRRQAVQPQLVGADWLENFFETHSWKADPEAELANELQKNQVRSALDELPNTQKEVILLAYFRGLTHSEIAGTLGLPLGTVKGRIRAGMKKLKRELEFLAD